MGVAAHWRTKTLPRTRGAMARVYEMARIRLRVCRENNAGAWQLLRQPMLGSH